MQLARLVEPAPHTWWEKCREAFRAMQLQRHLSSNQLLALYLNHSKYGRPVEGIAARRVFPQRAMAAADRSTWVDRGRSTRSDRALAATNPG